MCGSISVEICEIGNDEPGVSGGGMYVGHEHKPSVQRLAFAIAIDRRRVGNEFLKKRAIIFPCCMSKIGTRPAEVTGVALEAGEGPLTPADGRRLLHCADSYSYRDDENGHRKAKLHLLKYAE